MNAKDFVLNLQNMTESDIEEQLIRGLERKLKRQVAKPIDLDKLYKEWSGKHHTINSNKLVHDSTECVDFAEYCINQLEPPTGCDLRGVLLNYLSKVKK